MRKFVLLIMLAAFALSADAQWKIGKATGSMDYYNLSIDKDSYYVYTDNGDGTVTVYVLAFDLSANEWMVGFSPVQGNIMEFAKYYYGEVTDPKDEYVNVRKGPGRNYSVVEKLYVGEYVCYQKATPEWLKVYRFERNGSESLSGVFEFLGYVYHDRIKTPEYEPVKIEERKLPELWQMANLKCPDDNHPHAVDLGIGTKWACCNVDANSPLEYGGYYAWGETKTKNHYGFGNHLASDIRTDIACTANDVAHLKWGDKWRIPSEAQMRELEEKCKYQWVVIDHVRGGLFTGPNGNSIFLPAAGRFNGDSTEYEGTNGYYNGSTYFVFNLNFDSNYCDPTYMGEQLGCPVRPILK